VASVRDTVTATEHELAGLAGDIAAIARADCVTVPRPSPGRALLRIAQDADAALIVLGPTRKRAVLAALTGSPTRSLLRSSECPLMICPATENVLAARMLHADSSDVVAASAPRAPVSDGVRRARDRRDRRR
jgi:hypothetical protein